MVKEKSPNPFMLVSHSCIRMPQNELLEAILLSICVESPTLKEVLGTEVLKVSSHRLQLPQDPSIFKEAIKCLFLVRGI